jgi:creatine kinase
MFASKFSRQLQRSASASPKLLRGTAAGVAAAGALWYTQSPAECDFTLVGELQKLNARLANLEKLVGQPPAAPKKKLGKNAKFDFGGVAKGDPKDSDDFAYLTYDALPKFTPAHKSAMAKHLTPELFAKLKDKKSNTGYTLSNVIQTGVETPHLGVGACAGDEDSWTVFWELYHPIIKDWHDYDPDTGNHPTDLDASKVVQTPEQLAKFNQYVASTRIRAARNISGFPLPGGSTQESAAGVEAILKKTFNGLEGDLKGKYYPLGGMTKDEETALQAEGFLFQKPKTTNLLTNAGAARFWPDSRGIFHNDNKTALCWCNEEDHCRIISMSKDGDVKAVFARFCALSDAMKASAEAAGAKLMHSEKLGFLGTCPSNIGTGLRGGVMICLPKLNEDVELLEDVCSAYDLQPRGSAGEHSAAVGAKWDISNKQRIGFSEVQLVQKMVDGITKVIQIEEMLAGGASKADVAAFLKK